MEIERMSKTDLHMHISGSYPLSFLKQIAREKDFKDLKESIDKITRGIDYRSVFNTFSLVDKIVDSEEKVSEGVSNICDALIKDNIRYVELRASLKDLGRGRESYIHCVLESLKSSTKGRDLYVNLLLNLKRDFSLENARETIDLAARYFGKGIVGLDVSGNEAQGNIYNILGELERAKEIGLPITIHLGEVRIKESYDILTRIQPKRISHAVNLDSDSRNFVLKNRVPIEICISSNLATKVVESVQEHPVFEYWQRKHPIVICTDDPLLFQTTISKEYSLFLSNLDLNKGALEKTTRDSIHYSFANAEQKRDLLDKLNFGDKGYD